MAKPVSSVKGSGIAGGLFALANVVGGASAGEAENRRRDEEDRRHALDVDKFDQSILQFEASLSENARQFDKGIDFSEEQSRLGREHDRRQTTSSNQFRTGQAALDRDLTRREGDRDRQVQNFRISEDTRNASLNRQIQARRNLAEEITRHTGGRRWDEIPDVLILDRNNRRIDPASIDLARELALVADGGTSSVIEMDPRAALALSEQMEPLSEDQRGDFTRNFIASGEGFIGLVKNEEKAAGLKNMELVAVGGDERILEAMSPEDRAAHTASIKLMANNTQEMFDKLSRDKVDLHISKRRRELELETSGDSLELFGALQASGRMWGIGNDSMPKLALPQGISAQNAALLDRTFSGYRTLAIQLMQEAQYSSEGSREYGRIQAQMNDTADMLEQLGMPLEQVLELHDYLVDGTSPQTPFSTSIGEELAEVNTLERRQDIEHAAQYIRTVRVDHHGQVARMRRPGDAEGEVTVVPVDSSDFVFFVRQGFVAESYANQGE